MKKKNSFIIISFILIAALCFGTMKAFADESIIKAEAVKNLYYVTDHDSRDPDNDDYDFRLKNDFDIRADVFLDIDNNMRCEVFDGIFKDGKCVSKTTASYEGSGYITTIKINGVDINEGKTDDKDYDDFINSDYKYHFGTGEDIEIADGVIVNRTFKKIDNKIYVTYKLTNNSGKKITYDLGLAVDTYFLENDDAALFINDNKNGITITQDKKYNNLGYGAQFFINFESPVTTAWLGKFDENYPIVGDDDYYYSYTFVNSDVDYIKDVDGAAAWSWHDSILNGESQEKTVSFGASITYERKIKYTDPETNEEMEIDSIIGGAYELPELGEVETDPGYRQAWIQKQGDKITELENNVAIVPDDPNTEVEYYTDIVPIKYKIHFDTVNGERIDTLNYTVNDTINLPEAKKIGYKFKGWKVKTTDNEEKWPLNSIVSGQLGSNFMGNVSLEAQYEYKEYTLTIHADDKITTEPENTKSVLYGADEEIIITPEAGFGLKSIKVNGVERIQDVVNNRLFVENIREDINIIMESKELDAIFDETSKNQVINTLSKDYKASFRIINTNLQIFALKDGKVYIDNNLLDQDKYTLKNGSVIITLDDDFAKSLKLGKHNLKVTFNDNKEINTDFELVERNEDLTKNPKTYDNISMYIFISLISFIGLVGTSIYTKKRFN